MRHGVICTLSPTVRRAFSPPPYHPRAATDLALLHTASHPPLPPPQPKHTHTHTPHLRRCGVRHAVLPHRLVYVAAHPQPRRPPQRLRACGTSASLLVGHAVRVACAQLVVREGRAQKHIAGQHAVQHSNAPLPRHHALTLALTAARARPQPAAPHQHCCPPPALPPEAACHPRGSPA